MSKLSLTARKNIKENEPKLQENLKKIATASGITFEAEFDFTALAPVSDEKGYNDRIGEVLYDWYMAALANSVVDFCKDPIQKESFVEAFGEKKRITLIHVNEVGEWGYVGTKNDNGTLTMVVPKERFVANVDRTGQDLSKACSGSGVMNVATRKNIKDNEANRKKHLDRIQKATGLAFELDFDWPVLAQLAIERNSDYADRIGDIMYDWYLDPLAYNLEKLCKDDMSKEAIVEACTKKLITFKVVADSEIAPKYCPSAFVDGVLTFKVSKERFAANVSQCGEDLESHL